MKGCKLRMIATRVSEIECNGNIDMNEEITWKRFFFATALQGQHCTDSSSACQTHNIMKELNTIPENHQRLKLNLGLDDKINNNVVQNNNE